MSRNGDIACFIVVGVVLLASAFVFVAGWVRFNWTL